MKGEDKIYDLTIIGGGPVGLFTAFYAGMRQMSVHLIESLPQLGGQLSALYPEKYIYDIAGFPKISGQSLVDNLIEQMSQFEQTVTLNEEVHHVEKGEDGIFYMKTNQAAYASKAIIITAGNGAFQPRKLTVEVDQFEQNVHYFIRDLSQFKGKHVYVFGGGDSAVDWALMLESVAKRVTIVHRRDQFRAHESSVQRLMNSTVEVKTPFIPVQFVGEDQLERVVLEHVKSGDKEEAIVDEVVVNYGFVSSLGPIKNWGLEIKKNSIVVNSKMETNIAGIYAVGDICTYEGKIKLIASGFGEAPTAVSFAKVYIDPKAKIQTTHSTTLMEQRVKKQVGVG